MRHLSVGDVIRLYEREVNAIPVFDFVHLKRAVEAPARYVAAWEPHARLDTAAAILLHSIVRWQPFIEPENLDGNERVAVVAVGVFYGFNGVDFDPDPADLVRLVDQLRADPLGQSLAELDLTAKHLASWTTRLANDPN